MSITRRDFSAGLAAVAASQIAAPAFGYGDDKDKLIRLEARAGTARLLPVEYPETVVWGFDGRVPGPTIRLRQGERVMRSFANALPQSATIHWHGIRLENAMDGVPALTQAAVPAGDEFVYDFIAPDAGTYWYHPHNRSWEQMARGLYGALVVEEADGGPEVDDDQVLLIDDWLLMQDGQIAEGFGEISDWAHGGRLGNWITVNGDGAWSRDVERFSRHRLRLVNTANARIMVLEFAGFEGVVTALDGMPLPQPEPLGRLILAPAQRADLIVDVTADEGLSASIYGQAGGGPFEVASFDVNGVRRSERLPRPNPLPPNPAHALVPRLDEARSVDLLMEGGAMGRMATAIMDGRTMDIGELVANGKIWAFNGMADMPGEPLVQATRGETVRVRITNDTAWPHAMHLHGHHFRVVGNDGKLGPLRDTFLMDAGERAEIAFVADNPGDWLFHCHMLEHTAGGMMTWLRVV